MGLPSTVPLSGQPPSLGVSLHTSVEAIREALQVRFPTISSKWTQKPTVTPEVSVGLGETVQDFTDSPNSHQMRSRELRAI